jgi:hypothetical protein
MHAPHLRHAGNGLGYRADHGQVMGLMQRCEGHRTFQHARHAVVDHDGALQCSPPWTTRWPTAESVASPKRSCRNPRRFQDRAMVVAALAYSANLGLEDPVFRTRMTLLRVAYCPRRVRASEVIFSSSAVRSL